MLWLPGKFGIPIPLSVAAATSLIDPAGRASFRGLPRGRLGMATRGLDIAGSMRGRPLGRFNWLGSCNQRCG